MKTSNEAVIPAVALQDTMRGSTVLDIGEMAHPPPPASVPSEAVVPLDEEGASPKPPNNKVSTPHESEPSNPQSEVVPDEGASLRSCNSTPDDGESLPQ